MKNQTEKLCEILEFFAIKRFQFADLLSSHHFCLFCTRKCAYLIQRKIELFLSDRVIPSFSILESIQPYTILSIRLKITNRKASDEIISYLI